MNRLRLDSVRIAFAVMTGMTLNLAPLHAAEVSGETIYQQRCAMCHEKPVDRAPSRATLGAMQPVAIAGALVSGVMRAQASGLDENEILAVATFLGGRAGAADAGKINQPAACSKASPLSTAARNASAEWNGWSPDLENTRFQQKPGISAAEVPRLKVKWAYGFSGRMVSGQPTVVDDRVILTSPVGEVVALDVKTGCSYWIHQIDAGIRTAVSVGEVSKGANGKLGVFFGDEKANAHAIDADTGKALWDVKLDDHPHARITGSPRYYDGKVFVPVSSIEEVPGRDAKYECCKFRGSLVALDAATGKVLWKAYTIQETPAPHKKNSSGTQLYGPAGAAIWSAPTIDVKRKLIYVGTGNSYTNIKTDGNDAIVAFDMTTGQRKWINQVSPGDNYLVGCNAKNAGEINCPEDVGPDHDFGSSPILRTLPSGKQIILAGQKSGVVYGLDPDNQGKLLWQTRLGTGSALGGVEWGSAADKDRMFVAISDIFANPNPQPGLNALNLATGEKIWSVPTPTVTCSFGAGRCTRGQPGAVSAIPGVAFSGALDGHLRAYAAKDGAIIWDFDTGVEFQTVNGVALKGGSIDAGGAVIANGMVFVNSGYGNWGTNGRVMLVFTVDGK